MCSLCSSWYIWILSAYLIFMSVCEAFLFAMCLQQQYDFLVKFCCLYFRCNDHRLMCVDTIVLVLSGI
jgi:hypothetical protein